MALTMIDVEACKTLEEYAHLRNEIAARKKELNDEYGVKPFTVDAQSEWATLIEIDAELASRIAEVGARRAGIAEALADPSKIEAAWRPQARPQKARRVPDDIFAIEEYRSLSNSHDELVQAYRDGAMFAVEGATYPNPQSVTATEQEHIRRLLDGPDQPSPANPSRELAQRILQTGTPQYLRAFTKYIQGRPLAPAEQQAVAPWTVQTDATGGYMIPFYFDPSLLHVGAWTNVNPYRTACTVKTIVGTDTYNGATAAAFTVARAAEAAASTEGLGAVGQISAIVGKVHGIGTLSIEMLQDRPDVVSEIAALISEAKDTEEESSFTLGIGDALGNGFNPIGALAAGATTGAFTSLVTATATTLAADDADLVEAALPVRHRSGAAWFMSRAAIRAWQSLETVNGKLFGGQYYARTGDPANNAAGNTGLRLIDYPIWEVPSGAYSLVAATVIGALVNPSRFYIIERAGMSVEVIPHMLDATTGYPTGERGIYAWWRNTAKPADVNAGRRLAIKT